MAADRPGDGDVSEPSTRADLQKWVPIRPGPNGSPEAFARFADAVLAEAGVKGWAFNVIRDAQVVAHRESGSEDEAGRPVTRATLFNAESVAKPVIAWGVMRLVEAGKVDLDAPIETYFQHFRLPESEFDHSGVTVRRVLTHTSGLSWGRFENLEDGQPRPSLEELLSTVDDLGQRLEVEAPPGHHFNYSSGGYALLQLLIQDVSGRSFSEFMDQEILEPLGMNSTVFSPHGDPAPKFDPFGHEVAELRSNDVTGNSLRTTLDDLTTFALSHLRSESKPPGRGILSAASVSTLLSSSSEVKRRGLGYHLHFDEQGGFTAGHSGGGAEFRVEPASGDGLVFLSSAPGSVVRRVFCVWEAWIRHEESPCRADAADSLYGAYQRGGIGQALDYYRLLEQTGNPGYRSGTSQLSLFARALLFSGYRSDATQSFRVLSKVQSPWAGHWAEVAASIESGFEVADSSFKAYVGTYRTESGRTLVLGLSPEPGTNEMLLTIEGVPWESSVRLISSRAATVSPRGVEDEVGGEILWDMNDSGVAVRMRIDDPENIGSDWVARRQ